MRKGGLIAVGVVAVLAAVLAVVLLLARPDLLSSSKVPTADAPASAAPEQPAASLADTVAGAPSAAPASSEPFAWKADAAGVSQLVGPKGASIAATTVDGVGVAQLAGVPGDVPSSGRPGIFVQVPVPFERAVSGHTVRVTVTARAAPDNPSPAFAVAYSTADVGNSGWRPFNLTGALTDYTFTFAVPPMKQGKGDYIGILPAPAGSTGVAQISAITAEVLPDGSTP